MLGNPHLKVKEIKGSLSLLLGSIDGKLFKQTAPSDANNREILD